MLYVFFSIFVGVAAGLLLQHRPALRQRIIRSMRPLVLMLLVVLGINLGANPMVWEHFGALGWSSAVLAVCSVAGSIVVGSLYQLLPNRKRKG